MLPTLPRLSAHTKLLSTPFKRSQKGLFHGALIQFGNNVPFSKHKTRRTWLPNVQQKGLRSELLGRELEVKVTARALRSIKKYGGLDEYVLNTRHELLGPEGMRIRLMLRSKQEELALALALAQQQQTVSAEQAQVAASASRPPRPTAESQSPTPELTPEKRKGSGKRKGRGEASTWSIL